ncbi:hypothetical protein C0992_003804 [Termitomyces sp. T32_za158]|nr:hypothetical protein C0992_003804 [Termitomyces sp. T32_za158]
MTQRQCVRAVRHLPEQNHLLIWRTICISQGLDHDYDPPRWVERHAHGLELVSMSYYSHDGRVAIASPHCGHLVLPDGNVESVYMTDDLWPYDVQGDFPLQASSQPPPPISIFAEMTRPQGILHWHLWPDRRPTQDGPSFFYDPCIETVTKQTMYNAQPYIGHIIPGVFRSLVYTTESTDRTAAPSLMSLRRYISPEFQTNSYRLERVQRQSSVERCEYPSMPRYVYATIDLGHEAAARYRECGLGVITWDEAIGRVCMTTGGGSIIEVMDFSHAVKPGERFLDWKMSCPAGFEFIYEEEEGIEFAIARKSRLKRYPHLGFPSDEDVDMELDSRSVASDDSFYH